MTATKKTVGRPKNKTTKIEASNTRVSGTEKVHADKRPKRISLHDQKNIMHIQGKQPGFEYRIVNDINDRIERFKLAGWECVTHSLQLGDVSLENSESKGGVKTINVRGGIIGYVMRIREDWYKEDQVAKQADLDASQEEMYRELNTEENGRYGKVQSPAKV